jgi:hypothetical protein
MHRRVALRPRSRFLVLIMGPVAALRLRGKAMIVTPALEITQRLARRSSSRWGSACDASSSPRCACLTLSGTRLDALSVSRRGSPPIAHPAFWLARADADGRSGKVEPRRLFRGVRLGERVSPACRSRSRSRWRPFGYLALTTQTPMLVMVGRLDEGMSHLILLAVPLFIFLGALIEMTGHGARDDPVPGEPPGHVRGGLSYVLIGACTWCPGISGSKVADMAAIAPSSFPEMKRAARRPATWSRCLPRRVHRPRPFRRASC